MNEFSKRAAWTFFTGGKNFRTPNIVRHGHAGDYVYELSIGEFVGEKIWGVAVKVHETGEDAKNSRGERVSKCCFSLDEAEDYIRSLKKGV